MNTELLFSMNPFTFSGDRKGSGNVARSQKEENATNYISPQMESEVEIDADTPTTVDIPEKLRNRNVFIRVDSNHDARAANQGTDSDTFYDHQLLLHVKERYGQIQVLSQSDRRPIQKAYCKVFAKTTGGTHEFYKDGYSDIRGCFDYAAVSSNKLQNATQFAILIVTEHHGAAVKYAKPPKR